MKQNQNILKTIQYKPILTNSRKLEFEKCAKIGPSGQNLIISKLTTFDCLLLAVWTQSGVLLFINLKTKKLVTPQKQNIT